MFTKRCMAKRLRGSRASPISWLRIRQGLHLNRMLSQVELLPTKTKGIPAQTLQIKLMQLIVKVGHTASRGRFIRLADSRFLTLTISNRQQNQLQMPINRKQWNMTKRDSKFLVFRHLQTLRLYVLRVLSKKKKVKLKKRIEFRMSNQQNKQSQIRRLLSFLECLGRDLLLKLKSQSQEAHQGNHLL